MSWNVFEIKAKLDKLLLLINDTFSQDKIIPLLYDYTTLNEVLKIVDNKEYLNYLKKLNEYRKINNYDLNCILNESSRDFDNESVESILLYKEKIVDLLIKSSIFFDSYKFANLNSNFKKNDEKTNNELTSDFLINSFSEMNEIYNELLKSRIFLIKNNKQLKNFKGFCYQTFLDKDSFIVLKENCFSTLPHELAHAYEFKKIIDFNSFLQFHKSTFCESFPVFMELAYEDYYKTSEYNNIILRFKRELFEDINVQVEYYLSDIENIKSFDGDSACFITKDGKRISKRMMDSLISNYVAISMFNLYKSDMNKFKDYLIMYQNSEGISDKKIWDMISFDDLKRSFVEEANNYNKEAKLTKKKIKLFLK